MIMPLEVRIVFKWIVMMETRCFKPYDPELYSAKMFKNQFIFPPMISKEVYHE